MQSNKQVLTLSMTLSGTVAQYGPVSAAGAPATAASNAIGFAPVGGVSGDIVAVIVMGTSLAVAGAAIAAGALVEVGSTPSQVVTRSAGVSIGRALNAASAAGDFVEVLILQN
jgi:hypothetical protein